MMFKFCTQCGAKMPQENVFCTQCGAKFPVNTVNEVNNTTVQPVKSSKITDIALPKKEQVQNLSGNNLAVNKMAQDEFALGKEFMNAANPLHDYEKAIIHLKNAASSGIREAVVYIALSHLYLAADIIKIAMNRVSRRLREENLKSKLILQVHDELLIETAREEEPRVAAILEEEMKGAADLSVALEVDMHTGENWYEAK